VYVLATLDARAKPNDAESSANSRGRATSGLTRCDEPAGAADILLPEDHMHTLAYMTLDNDTRALRQTDADAFAARISGGVLRAADGAYEEARKVWHGTIDRRPALIARCLNDADVRSAVRFAGAHRMLVSVRGGGHHIAGNAVAEGGLMIDLSGMRAVSVDAGNRTARVGPGALLADFDRAAQAHGLATPLGINSTTGVAGLTLGGGFGWLTRRTGRPSTAYSPPLS
jgi:FAD/FMN-containing dehydrogenase